MSGFSLQFNPDPLDPPRGILNGDTLEGNSCRLGWRYYIPRSWRKQPERGSFSNLVDHPIARLFNSSLFYVLASFSSYIIFFSGQVLIFFCLISGVHFYHGTWCLTTDYCSRYRRASSDTPYMGERTKILKISIFACVIACSRHVKNENWLLFTFGSRVPKVSHVSHRK